MINDLDEHGYDQIVVAVEQWLTNDDNGGDAVQPAVIAPTDCADFCTQPANDHGPRCVSEPVGPEVGATIQDETSVAITVDRVAGVAGPAPHVRLLIDRRGNTLLGVTLPPADARTLGLSLQLAAAQD